MLLHCYAFDCATHHLFHPRGSNSLLEESDEETLHEAVFDNSLVREYNDKNTNALWRAD